jgi:hypothetical protein
MKLTSRIAVAIFAAIPAIAVAESQEPCGKNHYILDFPCTGR